MRWEAMSDAGEITLKTISPSNLPKGWAKKTLGEVCTIARGGSPRPIKKFITDDPNGINWIKIGDTKNSTKYITATKEKIRPEGAKFSRIVHEGDFILSNSMSFGRPYIMKTSGCIHDGWLVLQDITPNIDQDYLYYILSSNFVFSQFDSLAVGSTVRNLNSELVRGVEILIPPLDEQKRIAEKLDSLLTRVDSCERHLDRVPQILKRFRQSVLAAATSGRLTEDWREEDNITSRDFGDFEFPEFPTSWNLLPIKEIAQVKGGKRLPNGEKLVDHDTGFPYIRAGQLKKGTVSSEGQLYLLPSTQKKISRYIVDAGDVYITIVGASIGDAGVIPQNYDKVNLTENAAKICQLSGVDGNYLALWLRSPQAQDIIQSLIKSGAQGKLALTRINEIPVPLPSLEEQAEIVRRVESLFAYAERLEARYLSASEWVARLTPSLLAKGFRGELVEQDPNDESAVLLLESVKARREDVQPQKTSPRGRKGNK
jgi:type I restriction enzyme S subunit